jgi:hypothetical protein
MKDQIEAILQDLPDVHIRKVGHLWQIRIGKHAGAREDGLSLARDMLAMHQARERAMAEPVPVEIPAFLLEPVPKAVAEPEPVLPVPKPESIPPEFLDLVRENEPYGDTRERLWSVFVSIQHKLADDGKTMPKATSEEVLLYTRLYPHMGWLAKPGAVEVI